MYSFITAFAVLLFVGPAFAATDDLETNFQSLKDAVAKKDSALVKKLAVETCTQARQVIATPDPAAAEEKAELAKHKAYAREIETYTEYALYATAVQSPSPTMIDLFETLEQQSPKSKYLDESYANWFAALNQTGGAAKILALAEKALKNFPSQEDALLVLTDNALSRKNTAAAGAYAERLLAALSKHSKPEGMPQSDWDRKRTLALGHAYWTAGLAHGERNEYAMADSDFRASLSYIKDNPQMLAPAYFYLGVANYNLGRAGVNRAQILEGAKYSDLCAAIRSPYQQQAWTNAHLMKTEADRMVARK